jgi:hypothetical protein
MLGQTVRLFIKALIIGVLVNMGLQQISTGPLLDNENSALQRSAPHQMPLNSNFSPPNQPGN